MWSAHAVTTCACSAASAESKSSTVAQEASGKTLALSCAELTERQCAGEGGQCSCTGDVKYGSGNRWSGWKKSSGSTSCNNGVFGDPWPGVRKACVCKSSSSADSSAEADCAGEGGQ